MYDKSKWFDYGLPCPCGKSSDAYAIDKEGDGFCFSCSKYFKDKDGEFVEEETVEERPEIKSGKSTYEYHPHRNISKRVYEFYDVKTRLVEGEPFETGFQYPDLGVKLRRHVYNLPKEKWYTKGTMSSPGLFGKDKFDPGGKESITISEGMYDALSVYQITRTKTASVCVTSASNALRDIKQDWEYVNSFKKIYLCFDNDEPGRKATKAVASLFDFKKVYQVRMTKYKDPTEYLENNDADAFLNVWENARRFAPENIISSFNEIEAALKQDTESCIGTWPFKRLQEATYGLHEGEVVVIKGLEKIGKTEVLRALEHHLLKTTKHNVGIIHLEEDNGTTIKAIAGYELRVPAILPDSGLSDKDILEGYKKAVGDDEGRVFLYSSFETEDTQVFLDNIRFLVAGAGCKFIILDHITWLATGRAEEDERKKLDKLSQDLKLLAKELRFCLIMVSHVNDMGLTRGSRNITKVANTILHVDRNKTAEDDLERRKMNFILEGVRLGGESGPMGFGLFDRSTGRLEDGEEQMQMEFRL